MRPLLWLRKSFQCHVQSTFYVWEGGRQSFVHTVSCYRHGYLHRGRQVFCEWSDTMKHFVIADSERLAKMCCTRCQLFEASYLHERRDSLLKMKPNHSPRRACSAVMVAIKTQCSGPSKTSASERTEMAGCVCVCWCVIMSVCWRGWRGESCQCCPTQRR